MSRIAKYPMNTFHLPGRRSATFARAWTVAAVLSVAVLLTASSRTRADNIDEQLIKQAPKLIDYLRKNEMTKVGVLRFRVQKGSEPPSFAAGPMNTNMADRLENLLVLACDKQAPLHVLFQPGQVIAAQKAKMSYLDSKGRGNLFKLKYPAIGAEKRLEADVFLMGEVALSSDYRQTTVTVRAFSSTRLTPETVLRFTVPTDRFILADVGENFIIAKRSVKKGVDLDKAAIRSIKKNGLDPGKDPDPNPGPPTLPNLTEYVQFSILYSGEDQKIDMDAAKEKWRVAEPRKDQTVVMKIKNLTDKTIGVVLCVGGKSTIYEHDGDWTSARKWVLDPKKEYEIRGYYSKDETVSPFKVIPADEAGELLDDKAVGIIQYAVFDQSPEAEKKISRLRGETSWNLRQKRAKSFNELSERVTKATHLKRGEGGVIEPDDVPVKAGPLREVPFDDATLVSTRTIEYFNLAAGKNDGDKGKKN